MKPVIPDKFKERYGQLVDDTDAFFTSLLRLLPKSFRVNTLKTTIKIVKERFEKYGIAIKQVPWYPDAFVSENPDIGSTLENFLGNIYIQELTSMLPPLVLKTDLLHARLVLDGCAAPGSKTTQLAAFMKNQGTIIANDIDYNRIRALKFNIENTGTLNTLITNHDLRNFPKSEFDIILVDAPCSSEGVIRKNPIMLSKWPNQRKRIPGYANLQQQFITKAFDLLKPGGCLVYSTCTFAPEENEGVINWLLEKRPTTILEKITIPKMKLAPGIPEWDGKVFDPEIRKTVRIWPHHNNTDGFFLAKVRK